MDQKKLSVRKTAASALERVASLENNMQQVAQTLNQLGEVSSQLGEVLDALVAVVGEETVREMLKTRREARIEEQAARAKQALDELIAKQLLVKAESVSGKCLVVGNETDASGKTGRMQLEFSSLKPEVQQQLLGKPAGFTLETSGGGKFEVVEIYEVNPNPPPAEAAPADATPASQTTVDVTPAS